MMTILFQTEFIRNKNVWDCRKRLLDWGRSRKRWRGESCRKRKKRGRGSRKLKNADCEHQCVGRGHFRVWSLWDVIVCVCVVCWFLSCHRKAELEGKRRREEEERRRSEEEQRKQREQEEEDRKLAEKLEEEKYAKEWVTISHVH